MCRGRWQAATRRLAGIPDFSPVLLPDCSPYRLFVSCHTLADLRSSFPSRELPLFSPCGSPQASVRWDRGHHHRACCQTGRPGNAGPPTATGLPAPPAAAGAPCSQRAWCPRPRSRTRASGMRTRPARRPRTCWGGVGVVSQHGQGRRHVRMQAGAQCINATGGSALVLYRLRARSPVEEGAGLGKQYHAGRGSKHGEGAAGVQLAPAHRRGREGRTARLNGSPPCGAYSGRAEA